MGARFVSKRINRCSGRALSAEVDSVCSGWGERDVSLIEKAFESYESADEWILDHSSKYGPLLIVKALNADKKPNKIDAEKLKIGKLLTSLGHTNQTDGDEKYLMRDSFMRVILKRVKSSKSRLKGCESCGSKVAINCLNRFSCPVCQCKDFLLTETDKKKWEVTNAKISEIEAKIGMLENERECERAKRFKQCQNKKNWFWLIGGTYPE